MSTVPEVIHLDIATDDFGLLQESAPGWDQQYYQMSPGKFEGLTTHTQVGEAQIFREKWNRKLRYEGTAPNVGFAFALTLAAQGTANWVGHEVDEDTVILQAPGQEAQFVSSESWDTLVLAVPEDEVEAISTALSGDAGLDRRFHGKVTLDPATRQRLVQNGLDFLKQAREPHPGLEMYVPRYAEQFMKMFVWEIIRAQGADSKVVPPRPQQIVAAATDLAQSDLSGRLGLTELCAQLNLSMRSLHYAFLKVTGTTPATWLRRIRLNQVRAVLSEAGPSELMVKQAAFEHGFLHLGHFTDQYKRLFGYLPSETLRAR